MSDGVIDDAATEPRRPEPRRPDPRLLAILVCPLTRMPLRHDMEANELINDAAGLAYPIRDGVPIMLVEEAREV